MNHKDLNGIILQVLNKDSNIQIVAAMLHLSLNTPGKFFISSLQCSTRCTSSWQSPGERQREAEEAYRALGLHTGASKRQVKEAFYRLSKELHPDVSKIQSTEKFQKLNEAYTLLCKHQVDGGGDRPAGKNVCGLFPHILTC